MPRVEFYFDFLSPWSYLAFVRLREAAMRTSAEIHWKPLDVARVFTAVGGQTGQVPATAYPARDRYRLQDLADWAEFCGVVIRQPARPQCSAGLALSCAAELSDSRQMAAYSERVFDAYFGKDQDVSNPVVVRGILASMGLDPESIEDRARSARILKAIEANADELVHRGGFGVPTMFVGEKMFFGNDRLPLVELALTRAAERPFIAPGAHGQPT